MNEEPLEKEEIDAAPIEAAIDELGEQVRADREARELRLRTRPQSPSTEDDDEQGDTE